ncbi:MAG: hypothetical protein JXR26_03290 [Balneolaceae bacterium]|nr:hypothetical protein [Balneolaceae bacterium]
MIYDFFYWLHILSSVAWLAAFGTTLFFAFRVGRAFASLREKELMRSERKASSIGAHFGAAGILISGWVMSVMPGGPQWGWFNIPLYNWLAIKQLVFIIILVLVGFSIKKSASFRRKLKDERGTVIRAEARKKWKSAYVLSLVIYFLVVLNTYLGITKPI